MPAATERLRGLAQRSWERAMEQNMRNIVSLAAGAAPVETMLDLGCDAGGRSTWIAARVGAQKVCGVEIDAARAVLAEQKGVLVRAADLNGPLPYRDGEFDLVVSNQVIEHVWDTDNFVAETLRMLRPGGIALISTENLSAWHNLGAQLVGWQPFSLTNISTVAGGIGNPAALHRGEPGHPRGHLRVFSPRGLRELFAAHGFEVVRLAGAGYFPLPRVLAQVDPRHSVFLTIKARRPEARAAGSSAPGSRPTSATGS